MYEQIEKPKENTASADSRKSRAVANSFSQKKNGGKLANQFLDNRPEAVTQRQLLKNISSDVYEKQLTPVPLLQHQSALQKKDLTQKNGGHLLGAATDTNFALAPGMQVAPDRGNLYAKTLAPAVTPANKIAAIGEIATEMGRIGAFESKKNYHYRKSWGQVGGPLKMNMLRRIEAKVNNKIPEADRNIDDFYYASGPSFIFGTDQDKADLDREGQKLATRKNNLERGVGPEADYLNIEEIDSADMNAYRGNNTLRFLDPFVVDISVPYGAGAPYYTLTMRVQYSVNAHGYVIKVTDTGAGIDSTINDGDAANPTGTGIPSTFNFKHDTTDNRDLGTLVAGVNPANTRKQNEIGIDAHAKVAAEGSRWLCVKALGGTLHNNSKFYIAHVLTAADVFAGTPGQLGDNMTYYVDFKTLWGLWDSDFSADYNITNAVTRSKLVEKYKKASYRENLIYRVATAGFAAGAGGYDLNQ
ncbi:hypothetical protein PA25_05270 [Pseudoalteromonas sp. A25]|uniref:hypothetical protein n=1 Tax=Pseudoalteromonas sp. A25 TaxID=116092 RepID=UPI0012610C39|nr:hypothetical protein [Pseudoalteromonas sp. A25]BBN80542.1 hypothetical protein PA25_05270 [Pseudoalteromonas sp. A25]